MKVDENGDVILHRLLGYEFHAVRGEAIILHLAFADHKDEPSSARMDHAQILLRPEGALHLADELRRHAEFLQIDGSPQ